MAVYTDVSFEELKLFLAAYDLGEPHVFKGIAEGVSNSNYFLQTVRGSFILTLYEMRVEAEHLPFYLGLMEYLSQRGVCCPVPVHAHGGRMTGEVYDNFKFLTLPQLRQLNLIDLFREHGKDDAKPVS